MTDKNELRALFDRLGIEYREDAGRSSKTTAYDWFATRDERSRNKIVCLQGDKKVRGFSMFYTVFEFDKNGTFVEMGAYE